MNIPYQLYYVLKYFMIILNIKHLEFEIPVQLGLQW